MDSSVSEIDWKAIVFYFQEPDKGTGFLFEPENVGTQLTAFDTAHCDNEFCVPVHFHVAPELLSWSGGIQNCMFHYQLKQKLLAVYLCWPLQRLFTVHLS